MKIRPQAKIDNFAFTNISYRFLPNFKKLCDFDKLQITLSRKRFPKTQPFPIFENE